MQDKGERLTGCVQFKVIESGPVSVAVLITREVEGMLFTQKIRLYANLPYVEFDTKVVWSLRQQLLKVLTTIQIKFGREITQSQKKNC